MVAEIFYNNKKTSQGFSHESLSLLAQTECNIQTVLLGDLSVELFDRGHTAVPATAVHTPSLDGF